MIGPRLGGEALIRELLVAFLAEQRQVSQQEIRQSMQDLISGIFKGKSKEIWWRWRLIMDKYIDKYPMLEKYPIENLLGLNSINS